MSVFKLIMKEGTHFLNEHDRKDTNGKGLKNVVHENVSCVAIVCTLSLLGDCSG